MLEKVKEEKTIHYSLFVTHSQPPAPAMQGKGEGRKTIHYSLFVIHSQPPALAMQEKVKEEKLFPIHFPYSLPNPGPYGAGRGSEKKLFTIHYSLPKILNAK